MYSHYLDTFICVADIGSFSRAGEEMFISATAVMKQINQMEVKLGVQLFERTSKGLVLTPAGLLVELWAHSRWATMQRPDALPLRLLLQKSMPSKK